MEPTASKMKPTNPLMDPLVADKYEFTMAYGWWKLGMSDRPAVTSMFFRRNPFQGEFTVFAGLEEVVRFLADYRFTKDRIQAVREQLERDTAIDPGFYDWLRSVDLSGVKVRALREGRLAFPRVPLFMLEGPVAHLQLLESALLVSINYPSLEATAAARLKLAAGPGKRILEFGLRRAPDGGFGSSRYTYMGGADATSNMKAGQLFAGIPTAGTMAHAWIQSFLGLEDLRFTDFEAADGRPFDMVETTLRYRRELDAEHTNEAELASFIGYAYAYPRGFLALIDTYDTVESGLPNFLAVALALAQAGYGPIGIRLDSGDLSYLSRAVRRGYRDVSSRFGVHFESLAIVASNDIDEETIIALNAQGHEIDTFGVGTNLVMPGAPLGCVYKTVQILDSPRIKVSSDPGKTTIPGDQRAYRLYDQDGRAVADLITLAEEEAPLVGDRVLCRHPFEESKRVIVIPSRVEPLHVLVWDGAPEPEAIRPLHETRDYIAEQLASFRPDHLRPVNPTPYKVSVSQRLYAFIRELLESEVPIGEIR